MFGRKYRYCRSRMIAYINGELPANSRRRMSRYIDECPQCYAEYVRQRAVQRELQAELPSFGQPDSAQLARIWSGIQRDLNTPRRPHYQARYGLVTLGIMVVLVLPLTLGRNGVSQVGATQPPPREQTVSAATTSPQAVAAATQVPNSTDDTSANSVITPQAAPQWTPEPNE